MIVVGNSDPPGDTTFGSGPMMEYGTDRRSEDSEPCGICQKELKKHDFRTCVRKARVRSDFWGRFTVQPSNPKEKLDRCPVDPRNHSHQTLKELKECFFKKKPMFESSRRVEWQLMLRGLRLIEAEEPCPKCGWFWKDHNPTTCWGVGTREDNLWVIHEHFYPEILRILKEIVQNCGAQITPHVPFVMLRWIMTGSNAWEWCCMSCWSYWTVK